MPRPLDIALCQINPTVGDIAGNERRIVAEIERAAEAGAQLVLFPELAVTGYPPEDLLLKEHFLMDARGALERSPGARTSSLISRAKLSAAVRKTAWRSVTRSVATAVA